MLDANYDQGVKRSWDRRGKNLPNSRFFHWGLIKGDLLLQRQVYMMREGRHSLHNLIRGDHGLPNRY